MHTVWPDIFVLVRLVVSGVGSNFVWCSCREGRMVIPGVVSLQDKDICILRRRGSSVSSALSVNLQIVSTLLLITGISL